MASQVIIVDDQTEVVRLGFFDIPPRGEGRTVFDFRNCDFKRLRYINNWSFWRRLKFLFSGDA